jgi:hypothetical protein
MDDIMNKIGDLLSDEESVKQLSELAQMLVSEDNSSESDSNGTNLPDIDISSVIKLTSLITEASRQDKNTDLLLALRPHLGVEKQKRVDKALKLLKLLEVWNMIKDSRMLQDLI